ncbi:MAG: TlpA disulfide reductase family protein [Pseudomonadota bacterium]
MSSLIRPILFPFLLLALAACDRGSNQAEQDVAANGQTERVVGSKELVGKLDISKRGTPMLNDKFQDPEGKSVQLADFIGKPLLVNIWATWCAPCIVEMPMLDELAVREKDRLKVLVVSQDLQGMEKVEPFFAKSDFKELEPYLDPENGLSFGFGTGVMPTTVLFDEDGKEVWRVVGAMDWHGAKAAALMEETLAIR